MHEGRDNLIMAVVFGKGKRGERKRTTLAETRSFLWTLKIREMVWWILLLFLSFFIYRSVYQSIYLSVYPQLLTTSPFVFSLFVTLSIYLIYCLSISTTNNLTPFVFLKIYAGLLIFYPFFTCFVRSNLTGGRKDGGIRRERRLFIHASPGRGWGCLRGCRGPCCYAL